MRMRLVLLRGMARELRALRASREALRSFRRIAMSVRLRAGLGRVHYGIPTPTKRPIMMSMVRLVRRISRARMTRRVMGRSTAELEEGMDPWSSRDLRLLGLLRFALDLGEVLVSEGVGEEGHDLGMQMQIALAEDDSALRVLQARAEIGEMYPVHAVQLAGTFIV